MKNIFTLLSLIIAAKIACAQFQFVSPKPGSTKLPVQHNIIIRQGNLLDPSSLDTSLFIIKGSKSGIHPFHLVLCDDGKTINLNPEIPFDYNETITVSIASGLLTTNNEIIPAYTFNFTTCHQLSSGSSGTVAGDSIQSGSGGLVASDHFQANTRTISGLFSILTNTHPAPGDIFFDSRPQGLSVIAHNSLNVIDNNGDSVFQRIYGSTPYDFQLGRNGYFDTYRSDFSRFDVMDSNFNFINYFSVKNGFQGDAHELTMLTNGNAFLTALEDQPVNDTSDAVIEGSVIQELDPDHNVIFEWRSFDHIDPSEAEHLDPQAVIFDYVHTNSIDIDNDGNIIVSHRHLDQINKIDVNTGEFIWRLGGVKNEFTFTNDTARFTFQHDCRRIANGDITMYDDGNYHFPPRSYAKEYYLDEVNKTARLVWSYTHPDVNGVIPYYSAMGSVQRLTNGNTFICWGLRTRTVLPSMTEVDSNGNIVWELTLATDDNLIDYRAHKYLWNPCARPSADSLKSNQINDHSVILYWAAVANPSQQYEVLYKKQSDSLWVDKKTTDGLCNVIISNLSPATIYDWKVRSWCDTVAGIVSAFSDAKTFSTGGNNPSNDYFLSVFPNPVSGELTIDCDCHISQVRIINLLGQEMKSLSFSSTDNLQLINLSVSDLSNGNYFVEITSDDKREIKKLMIVK